jgi:cytochrome bd ubiquinol oxidase subunit II
MLAGRILRGVEFEFRYKTVRARWTWDWCFFGGSVVATFIQGMTVGALVEGLPVEGGQYSGGDFGWFSPFAVLCGIGLCLGYALLGASWLVRKCEAETRLTAYWQMCYLVVGVLVFLVVAFVYALAAELPIMHRWLERPYLFACPALAAAAMGALAVSIRRRSDGWPFYMVALVFLSAFATLAISFSDMVAVRPRMVSGYLGAERLWGLVSQGIG